MGKEHLQLAIVNAIHQQSGADTGHGHQFFVWGGNDLAGTAFREATGTPLQLRFSVFYLRGDSTGNDRLGLGDIKPLRRFAAIAAPPARAARRNAAMAGSVRS